MELRSSKILLWSVLASAAIVAGWLIYLQIGGSGVTLEATAVKEEVSPGVPFDLEVLFGNEGKSPFSEVMISVHLPEGVKADGAMGRVVSRPLGDMAIGSTHRETFKLTALPLAAGAEQEITVVASYVPGPLSSYFEETATVRVRVTDPGFGVEITGPQSVLSGQPFEVEASYAKTAGENDAAGLFSDMELAIRTPKEYVLETATPETTAGALTWKVGESAPVTPVRISGSVSMPEGTMFQMIAELSGKLGDERFVIAEKKVDVTVGQSPLSFTALSLDGDKRSYAPGETVNLSLEYKNNAGAAFENAVIRMTLTGEMLDLGTIVTEGTSPIVNRTRGVVEWNRTALPALASIAPGTSGSIRFSVRLKNDYGIKRLNDKNFKVRIEGSMEAVSAASEEGSSRTASESVFERPVRGKITVDAKGYFRDASAGIVNTGPFPPRVGSPTTFIVRWQLVNYATDIKDVVVRAQLEDGVTIGGTLKSNTTMAPEIDPESGEIVWKIDRLSATSGLLTERPEAIFQVMLTPRPEHLGRAVVLITETSVTATDEWSGERLSGTDAAVTTALPDDPTTSEAQGVVLQ